MHKHKRFLHPFSVPSCLFCPIFSGSSAQMPSVGLIKAAPSCFPREWLAQPLASQPAGSPDHTHRRRRGHSCGSGWFIWTGFRHGDRACIISYLIMHGHEIEFITVHICWVNTGHQMTKCPLQHLLFRLPSSQIKVFKFCVHCGAAVGH